MVALFCGSAAKFLRCSTTPRAVIITFKLKCSQLKVLTFIVQGVQFLRHKSRIYPDWLLFEHAALQFDWLIGEDTAF